MAWRAVTNPLDPVRVLSDDHVEHIHLSSLRLLASTGMRVLHAGARDVLAAAGCEVDDLVVRFDPDLIAEFIAGAPSEFTLRARNPERDLIDAEMVQMLAAYLEPIAVDEATLAVEAIAEVGPGGHFFGAPHTMERYESAFYTPLVSDWRNFESWTEAGSVDATERAHRIWRTLLAGYEQPPLDAAIDEALTQGSFRCPRWSRRTRG